MSRSVRRGEKLIGVSRLECRYQSIGCKEYFIVRASMIIVLRMWPPYLVFCPDKEPFYHSIIQFSTQTSARALRKQSLVVIGKLNPVETLEAIASSKRWAVAGDSCSIFGGRSLCEQESGHAACPSLDVATLPYAL